MYKVIAIVILLFYFVVASWASERLISKAQETIKPTAIEKIFKEGI